MLYLEEGDMANYRKAMRKIKSLQDKARAQAEQGK